MNRDYLQLSADALLALALTEAEAREMAFLPSLEEMNRAFHPSDEFEARIKKLILRNDKKENRQKTRLYMKRASIAMAASVALFSCAMLPVKAVRQAVVETVIAWYDKFCTIGFSTEDTTMNVLPGEISLTYIPEGYCSDQALIEEDTYYCASYRLDNLHSLTVSITAITNHEQVSVDNEYSQYYSLEFDGHDAIWVTHSENSNLLIWEKDALLYNLSGDMDVSELIKIARGIKFN